jgi:4-hydroxythreonine-4-phosphate dehydrogenase
MERPSPSYTSGKVAVAYLGRAVVDAVYGNIDGLLTMPISKFWARMAGFSYEGQTEFLAQAFRVRDYAMLMYSETIKVALLSTHVSLKEAIERVKRENIVKKVKLLAEEFKRWFKKSPQVGVLGLNPHAGEGGTIGEEDIKEIAPAVEELKSMGYMVDGPLSPDTAFLNRDYDLFLCMYHDQGLNTLQTFSLQRGSKYDPWNSLSKDFSRPRNRLRYSLERNSRYFSLSACFRLCERLAKNNTIGF